MSLPPNLQVNSFQSYSCSKEQARLYFFRLLEIVETSYPKYQFLLKLEVAVFEWMPFYGPFCDCGLNFKGCDSVQRALSFFLRSLCSVPGFPSSLLLGIKQLTFLLFFFFLIFFIHPISLNDKPVGTGIPSFDVAAEHLGQGGTWCKPGLFGSLVPKLRSEGLQLGLGAHCKCSGDLPDPNVVRADGYLLICREKSTRE